MKLIGLSVARRRAMPAMSSVLAGFNLSFIDPLSQLL
jgi:hypothetical protein